MSSPSLRAWLLVIVVLSATGADAQDDIRSDPSVFSSRRDRLISELEPGAIVMSGAPVRHRNGDVDYEYRQASDFYYVTGFEEPGASLVLRFDSDAPVYHLIVPPKNPSAEIWDGYRAGVKGATAEFGADVAHSNRGLPGSLKQLLAGVTRVYYESNGNEAFDKVFQGWLQSARQERDVVVEPLRPVLSRRRQIKDADEIRLLGRAIGATCAGLREAMRAAAPGRFEYEVEAEIEHAFRLQGSPRNGFPSIVGSGPNTTTLHYTTNRRRMESGELLLMDVGAEFGYYTADVTRTIPVSGVFSEEQRAIYTIVLQAQQAGIEMTRPGIPLFSIHQKARRVIAEGLSDLGLIEKDSEGRVATRAVGRFFMHGTSHWLGMDVHDVGPEQVLAPGMVFTIEPGIYIRAHLEDVDPKYHNIGVRIEDDILVTEDGCQVLSESAPRTIADIEAWMAGEDR